jgi:MYXO-CTERM domain-containing protein
MLITALAAATIPARPRDYRLTADDARRLRSSGSRRWWRSVATPLDGISRPIGMGLATLGVIGLLVGTVSSVPGTFPGFGAAGAAASQAPAEGVSRSPADVAAGLAPASAAPSYETLRMEAPSVPVHGVEPVGPMDGPDSARTEPIVAIPVPEEPAQVPFMALSAGMAAAGFGLLGLRRVVRRRGAMR